MNTPNTPPNINDRFEVTVGNLGTVYIGDGEAEAIAIFKEYAQMSLDNYGRVSGEPVTLSDEGEPMLEHQTT